MTISETTDRVQQIGREFLKPMPKYWSFSLFEIHSDDGKGGVRVQYAGRSSNPYFEGVAWEHRYEASTPDEARRLCREEAERKSKS